MATTEKRTTKDGKTSYRCKMRRKEQSPLSATLNTKSDAEHWVYSTRPPNVRNVVMGSQGQSLGSDSTNSTKLTSNITLRVPHILLARMQDSSFKLLYEISIARSLASQML